MWWVTALWSTNAAMACDATKLAEAQTAAAAAPNPDLKRKRMLAGVNAACTLPPRLAELMKAMPSAVAQDGFKLELAAVRQSPSEWSAACPGGTRALEAGAAVRGPARRDALFEPCEVYRFKFVTSEEFAVANGYVFLSVLLAKHFEEARVEERLSVPILRSIAGVGERAAAPTGTDPWASAQDAASAAAATPWNGLDEGLANQLSTLCEALAKRPVAERISHRRVEFDVCAQAGRAIDGAGLDAPPYTIDLQGQTVNTGFYAAATLAHSDELLLTTCADEEIRNSVQWLVSQIRKGFLPMAR